MSIKIHNHFDFYKIKVGEKEQVHVGHAENIVLNNLYNCLWWACTDRKNGPGGIQAIHLGTGTGTPAVTDTSLGSFYSGYGAARTYVGRNNTYGYEEYNYTYEMQPTEGVGKYFSEIGLAVSTSVNSGLPTLCTKALITDNNGNPISILKDADEKLLIKATMYVYDPTYSVADNAPGEAYFPSWMLQWVGGNANWATKLHEILSNAVVAGEQRYYNGGSRVFVWLAFGGKFKGMSQIMFCNGSSYNPARTANYSWFELGNQEYNTAISAQTLNASQFNNADARLTNDIYKVLFQVANDYDNIYKDISCADVLNVPINSLTLGTGDGTQDTWHIPHEDAKNITCSAGTFTVVPKRISEFVPVIHPMSIIMFHSHSSSYSTLCYQVQGGDLIKWLNGVAYFQGWDNSSKYMYGFYYYYDTAKGQHLAIPLRVNIPTLDMPTSYIEVYSLPDNSGLLIYSKDSTTGGNFARSVVLTYDYTAGTVGITLYSTTSKIKFTQDMQYMIDINRISTASNQIRVFSLVRTASAITPTLSFTVETGTWNSNAPLLTSNGSSYIKDGIVKLAPRSTDLAKTFQLDFVNKTGAIIAHTGFAANAVSKNYAVSYASNILTLYSITNEVATSIYTLDLTGTSVVSGSLSLRSIVEYNNRVYVFFASTSTTSSRVMLILTQDTDGAWYNINDRNLNCPSISENGSNSYDDYVGVTYSEATIGEYTLVFNSPDRPLTGGHYSGYLCNEYGNSNWVPCLRRKAKIGLKFATPPAVGTSIVTSYTLDYLPKDSNWIMSSAPVCGFSRPS